VVDYLYITLRIPHYGIVKMSKDRFGIRAPASSPIASIIHQSESMKAILRDVVRVAQTDATVLLTGESGTGKELLAQGIHDLSPRAKGPFVAINCPAIPDLLLESELFGHEKGAFTGAIKRGVGKIEHADGGTLFLDEIGDIAQSTQVKLLRFMQTHMIERVGASRPISVNVRVVCATHRDLEHLSAEGRFREDLYYRINQVALVVPPVRERAGDAALLARHFLGRYSAEFKRPIRGFSPDAMQAINDFSWRGNVREIENRIKRGVIMAHGELLTAKDLGLEKESSVRNVLDLRVARLRAEAEVIRLALEEAGSNISRAAKLLGVSRPTLYSLIRQRRHDPAIT
jgi:two-component system, NtrC family, response regulator